MTDEPTARKATLRDRMRLIRDAMPPEERARRARLIEDRLLGLNEFRAAGMVLLFYSFGSEVATRGIASTATRIAVATGRRR